MKRYIVIILLIIASTRSFGNMSSPFAEGTLGCSAFSSRDIDILNEQIHIKIDKDFYKAKYTVEYTIQSDSTGNQIPLLFYAKDYDEDFNVWLDGTPIKLLNFPYSYKDSSNIFLEKFYNSFHREYRDSNSVFESDVASGWMGSICNIFDLKYFRINLTKGQHIVRVEYKAHTGSESFDWIRSYSFQYSLSPARYWKSFHSLDITIDATELAETKITTSLGLPTKGSLESIAYFHFENIPADYFSISYKPEPNFLASILIGLRPLGLSIILFLLLFYWHYKVLKKDKVANPESSSLSIVSIGSILIPLVVLIFSIFSFSLIDEIIGKDASQHHGYTIFIIFFYPVLLIVYWPIMTMISKDISRNLRLQKKSNNKNS